MIGSPFALFSNLSFDDLKKYQGSLYSDMLIGDSKFREELGYEQRFGGNVD